MQFNLPGGAVTSTPRQGEQGALEEVVVHGNRPSPFLGTPPARDAAQGSYTSPFRGTPSIRAGANGDRQPPSMEAPPSKRWDLFRS